MGERFERFIRAGKKAKFPWNIVKNCVKNVLKNIKNLGFFVRKRPKYPSKWWISPQNCKYFPLKFPGNKIPKFYIFSMRVLICHRRKQICLCVITQTNSITVLPVHTPRYLPRTCDGLPWSAAVKVKHLHGIARY